MPWVLLRTRNKNTGDRVNPHYSPLRGSAKNCQCSGFGGQRPPKHVQRPLNIFRSTWKCSEATKQLKTQLKTQLQTRVATLIKANVTTWVLSLYIRLAIRVFQVDNESKESVHSELGTLTCLVRSLKILLSALESHSGQATVPIKNQSRTSL